LRDKPWTVRLSLGLIIRFGLIAVLWISALRGLADDGNGWRFLGAVVIAAVLTLVIWPWNRQP
jgi:hypothetical protein